MYAVETGQAHAVIEIHLFGIFHTLSVTLVIT
jgi:hypothetical protein